MNINFNEIAKEAVKIYRVLHQHPELGMEEYETSGIIRQELEKMGLEVQSVCGTGLTAVIHGTGRGRTILYRADMDALPIQEETGLSFQSKNPGIMHACGHDIHMACALGTAKVIHQMRNQLHGNLKLMFQPCEENFPGGAGRMINAGVLKNPDVDVAMALHVTPDFEAGKYYLSAGAVTSAPSWFEIEIQGRGGHASEPDKCINPIKTAALIYIQLEELALHYKRKKSKAVICTTMLHGGSAQNIVPETCNLAGTVRTFSNVDTENIKKELESICRNISMQTGATVKATYRTSMNSVYNNPEVTEIMRQAIYKEAESKALITEPWTFLGGEDYAEISDRVPSVFLFAGAGNHEKNYSYPLHNGKFCADERMIEPAIRVMSRFIIQYLTNNF